MKLKTLVIVVAVLALASLTTWLFRRPDQAPALDPRIGQPLVAADVVAQVDRIELHSTSGTTVTLENTGTDDANWVVRSYHDLPADFSKLNTFVQNLRQAEFTRFASRNPERIARMDFNGARIVLQDKAGETLWSADLGRMLTGGRFVKIGDEETALVASLTASLDTTPKNWANAALVRAKAEDVREIEATFPDEAPLHFERADAGSPWITGNLPEGASIKTSEVSSLLNRLVGLRFSETTAPDAPEVIAAREQAREFKLTLAAGEEVTVALGRQPAPPAPAADTEATEDEANAETPAPETPQPGPVFAFVHSSTDEDLNAQMQKRGYQIQEWTYTSLPANRAALIQPPPAPAPEAAPAAEAESPPATEAGAVAPAR